eukprot:3712477-Amphidinium_carterae.1
METSLLMLGHQLILAGDWQMSPAELLRTGFVDGIHGVILTSQSATCCRACWAGAQWELDFFVE